MTDKRPLFLLNRRSLALRLALLFALLSTLILLGLGLFLRQAVEGHFLEQDARELRDTLRLVRRALSATPVADLDRIAPHIAPQLAAVPQQSLSLFDAENRVIFASASLPPRWLLQTEPTAVDDDFPPALSGERDAPAPAGHVEHAGHAANASSTSDQIRALYALARLQDGTLVKVAIVMSVAHHQSFIDDFMRSLVWALALAALANVLCATLAARRALSPLDAMATLARRVSGERLHERLATATLPVELQPLGRDLNAMLDRLEDAFARLSDFASDIAHELRTPLTALSTQTQVALLQTRSVDAYREVLYSSLEEYERLSAMIGDMLYLAQAENGLMLFSRESVDLARLLADLCEFYGILAEEKRVGLTVEGEAHVTGDAAMLRRALGNLISNAIRHTAPDGQIRIRLTTGANATSIAVKNPGDPIPPEQQTRIFERFYRADASRAREDGKSSGTGLGLAIARSIAAAHGGTLDVVSAGGENVFTLRLP